MARKILILIALVLLLAGGSQADYRWTYEGEELADLILIWYFNGDSIDHPDNPIADLDSGVTAFDTTLNIDSIGFGLFQIKARYAYINSAPGTDPRIYVVGWDDYDNSRGGSDGVCHQRIYTYDSLTPALISGAKVSIYTAAGQFVQTHATVNGYWDFRLAQGSDYIAYATDPNGCTSDTTHFTTDTGLAGTSIDTVYAICYAIPAPSPGVSYVSAFIDLGTGQIDGSGNMTAATNLKGRLMLLGFPRSTTPFQTPTVGSSSIFPPTPP
jgi:hypothetical protein